MCVELIYIKISVFINHISSIFCKVENFRGTKDFIGRSRNLGQGSGTRPYDYTYGKPSATARKAASGKPHFGALDVIRGNYSVEDQVTRLFNYLSHLNDLNIDIYYIEKNSYPTKTWGNR
jgi:hypothetical protein